MAEDRTLMGFTLNGRQVELSADTGKPLADLLRDDLAETSVQIGCRNGDCGACTVLIDGASIKSCMMPSGRISGQSVETLAGLATDDGLHPVQEAFWKANGFQCGYCLSGQVLCTVELLRATPNAERAEMETALGGNLCRCTGYQNVMAAAVLAAQNLAVESKK